MSHPVELLHIPAGAVHVGGIYLVKMKGKEDFAPIVKQLKPQELVYPMQNLNLFNGFFVHVPKDGDSWKMLASNEHVEYIAENAGGGKPAVPTNTLTPPKESPTAIARVKIPEGWDRTIKMLDPPKEIPGPDMSHWALWRLCYRSRLPKLPNYLYRYPVSAGQDVDIYILDSGLDLNKIPKEFPRGERLTDGHCTIDGEAVNTDKSGHGTWMAAIAGGQLSGFAKKANIIPVKIMSDKNESLSILDIFKGLDWITGRDKNLRAKNGSIINVSGGAPAYKPLNEVFMGIYAAGFFINVAAGQDVPPVNINTLSPQQLEHSEVITVGALQKDDTMASFSNFGNSVTFWAPGVEMGPDKVVEGKSLGTSPATALVTGVIALYLAEYKPKDQAALLEIMKKPCNHDKISDAASWGAGIEVMVPLIPGADHVDSSDRFR